MIPQLNIDTPSMFYFCPQGGAKDPSVVSGSTPLHRQKHPAADAAERQVCDGHVVNSLDTSIRCTRYVGH